MSRLKGTSSDSVQLQFLLGSSIRRKNRAAAANQQQQQQKQQQQQQQHSRVFTPQQHRSWCQFQKRLEIPQFQQDRSFKY